MSCILWLNIYLNIAESAMKIGYLFTCPMICCGIPLLVNLLLLINCWTFNFCTLIFIGLNHVCPLDFSTGPLRFSSDRFYLVMVI